LKNLFAVFCLAKHGFFVRANCSTISAIPSGYQFDENPEEKNMAATTTAKPEDVERCASIWFLRLERAREHRDHNAEKEARQRLKEMGVSVRFGREVSR